jgi:hypothetical protein
MTATLALLATALPSAASGDTVANTRNATAIYNDSTAALAAGYELLTDASDTACIDQPGAGAMGVHYVKGALIQSGTLDAARPQALVYEVQPNGQLRLGALEYVVFQSSWDAAHSAPPTLFGQKFMLNPADNRFGLPAFYSLHAWLWKHNPKGAFEPWNPQVHCGSQAAGFEANDAASPAPSMAGMSAAFTCSVPANETATDMELESPQTQQPQ